VSGRPEPVACARQLVASLFPDARQAWLAGSVALGQDTATSDLDVVVLLDEVEVHRESRRHDGWPVELFVHTSASVRHFVAQDLLRRQPTMARMVATGVPLLPGHAGADLRAECAAALAAGPGPLTAVELDHDRYLLTDLLDDLAGGGSPGVVDAVAIAVWRATAELLLDSTGRWRGTSKWLVREVEAYDAAAGTSYAARLHDGLHAALAGSPELLTALADEVLDRAGGRLWAGYAARAELPHA
jgi:hypothetical protein